MATVRIRDEAVAGQALNELTLDFLTEEITVRELITRRVYEEVQTYNTAKPGYFRGLVQPTDAEASLNGYRLRTRREIDWRAQAERALDAFERNGFAILVQDHQVGSLDERIRLELETPVTFILLVPLIGG